MIHTINYILFPHTLHCLGDHCLVAILDDSSEFLCSQSSELLLHFAKDKLNGIVVRLIGHVVHILEAFFLHKLLTL